jgi:hypothetical protein
VFETKSLSPYSSSTAEEIPNVQWIRPDCDRALYRASPKAPKNLPAYILHQEMVKASESGTWQRFCDIRMENKGSNQPGSIVRANASHGEGPAILFAGPDNGD